jgi:DNA-binding Lrp family transcriptional regulator
MTRIRFDGLARSLSARRRIPPDTPLRSHEKTSRLALALQGHAAPRTADARLSKQESFARLQADARRAREAGMIPFFVQIKCQLGKAYQVANELADAEIASEIYSTAGDFDLLVKFYVDRDTDIGHFVNEKVQKIAGIQDTRTIITFKAF